MLAGWAELWYQSKLEKQLINDAAVPALIG